MFSAGGGGGAGVAGPGFLGIVLIKGIRRRDVGIVTYDGHRGYSEALIRWLGWFMCPSDGAALSIPLAARPRLFVF